MDIIKKTLQFTKGIFLIGSENLNSLMKDIEKKYDLDAPTAKKIAKDVLKETKKSGKEIKEILEKHMKKILDDYQIKNKTKTKKKTSKKKTSKKKTVTKPKKNKK